MATVEKYLEDCKRESIEVLEKSFLRALNEIQALRAEIVRKDEALRELVGTHGELCRHLPDCTTLKNGRAALSPAKGKGV